MTKNGHHECCKDVPLSEIVAEREALGEEIPERVRAAAARGVSFMQCHEECKILEKVLVRGRELAAKHGW